MKKIIICLLSVLILIGTTGCNNEIKLKEGNNDLVTFKNNDLNITVNDLYNDLKEKYGTSTIIDMIDTKILNKEYADDDATNDYVNIQIDSMKAYYDTEIEFINYINQYGYETEDDLREYLKLNYKRNLATNDYLETLITEDEIQSYYNNNISGDITASHILIEVKTNNSMTEDESRKVKEEALKKAKEVITKLDEGKSFKELAKEYSNDELTKENGGSMGTLNLLKVDDVTRQELQKLKVNEYSKEPLETEYGYEIFFKVNEKEKPELKDVKKTIIEKLSNEKLTDNNKLQYNALIDIRERYGFKINDSDLEVYYENMMNNLLREE